MKALPLVASFHRVGKGHLTVKATERGLEFSDGQRTRIRVASLTWASDVSPAHVRLIHEAGFLHIVRNNKFYFFSS